MEKKFGKLVEKMTDTKTAGTPSTQVIQPKEKIDAVDEETQLIYRLGVGMLLYLVKHSQPDIANPTRELSKSLLMALEADWKKLLWLIRFVLKSRTVGLKAEPKLEEDCER